MADLRGTLVALVKDLVALVAFGTGLVGTFFVTLVAGLGLLVLAGVYLVVEGALQSAGIGTPSGDTMAGIGTILLVVVLFGGPAVWMGIVFAMAKKRRVGRPGVLLVVPVVLVVGSLGYLLVAGTTPVAIAAVIVAQIVLANRVFGEYAQDVRALSLGRVPRLVLGSIALLPASVIGVIEELMVLARFVNSSPDRSPYVAGAEVLSSVGFPSATVGAAAFTSLDLIVVFVPLFVCGGYLVLQALVGLPGRQSGVDPGRPSALDDAVERAEESVAVAEQRRADGDYQGAVEEYDAAHDAFLEAAETADDAGYGGGRYEKRADEVEDSAAGVVRDAADEYRDRVDEALDEARSAREAGEFGDALTAHERAAETAAEGLDLVERLRDLPVVPGSAVDDAVEGLRERRTTAQDGAVATLTERARRTVEEGDDLEAEDDLAGTVEAYRTARSTLGEVRDRADDTGVDPPEEFEALAAVVERSIERVETERSRREVEEALEAVEGLLATAESARGDGEFDDALSAYRRAREHCDEALVTARDAGLTEQNTVADRRELIDDAVAETERERALVRARTAIENGDELAEEAEDLAEAEEYARAEASYAAARDRYDEAVSTLEGYDVPEGEEAADKRDRAERERERAQLSALAERINDASGALEAGDAGAAREAFEAVVEETEALHDEVERTADLETLNERARAGALRARIVEGRDRIATAEEQFEAGEYREAEAAFEDANATFEEVVDRAEGLDMEAGRREADRLATVSADNAETARQAHYGVAEGTPSLRSAEAVEAADEPAEPAEAGIDRPSEGESPVSAGSGGAAGRSTRTGDAPTGEAVDPAKLQNEPPDFERLEGIGAGGSAEVTKVRMADSGEVLALKEPRHVGTLDTSVMESFAGEASTWDRLEHPNIVDLIDWGVVPTPWMLLEYMEGGDLEARIGDLAVNQGVGILGGLAEAVDRAHRLTGKAHTDIKPENVLFTTDDGAEVAKLADWGLARTMLGPDDRRGMTPEYAAPEQFDSERFGGVGLHTDLYQLGVLAYEVFAGRHPFEGVQAEDLSDAITDGEPEPPSSINPNLPPGIDDAIATAMAKHPEDRYEAPLYLRDRLRDALEGEA
ncbi:hypothetical protein BRD00_13745 [Halobacteriales archaeon QS_8_69_26]|nr:MAG: hypothetical protein BRD00_13745 [Halobacteriales archaeon QS_8_69_26]